MKILIVDDSKTMRHVLITQLKEFGYDSFVEADCVDKAKLLCSTETPVLIISDWNMPGASGLELLKYVRGNSKTSDVPFIMLTTETDRTKIVDATRAGLQSYLLKPIRKTILFEKMVELSAAYGFIPPRDSNVVQGSSMIVAQEECELKGKIKKEQITQILEAYDFGWNEAFANVKFEEFLASEIFGGSLQNIREDVTLFLDTMKNVALDAIDHKLNQIAK